MKENNKPCSSRVLFYVEILTPLGKVVRIWRFLSWRAWICDVPVFAVLLSKGKGKYNEPVKTSCCNYTHCWLICYETDMGPELSTAAADQTFAWICKQHQDLIGLVLIFRTKIIWSRLEFGLVRCGYLNTAIVKTLWILEIKAIYWEKNSIYTNPESFL